MLNNFLQKAVLLSTITDKVLGKLMRFWGIIIYLKSNVHIMFGYVIHRQYLVKLFNDRIHYCLQIVTSG